MEQIKRAHPMEMGTGIQKIYRFDNGYGASIIKTDFSYGGRTGLWELAVILFRDDASISLEDANWVLVYDTGITGDVIGYLSDDKVDYYLKQIEALPVREGGLANEERHL